MQLLNRRHVLLGGAFEGLALAGCAGPAAARAGQPVTLAPGVYMVPGSGGAADESNLGRIGNAGFIVGEAGVIAVDTGTSYAHGQALLNTIRTVTPLPVRQALVTHTRPEFLAPPTVRKHPRARRYSARHEQNAQAPPGPRNRVRAFGCANSTRRKK